MILCCVANWVAEFEAILSSSSIAVPDTSVFNTALVKVLFVNVCVWSSNTNVSLSVNCGKAIVRDPCIFAPRLRIKLLPLLVSVKTGLFVNVAPLKVLFVRVCDPVKVATVESIAKDILFVEPVVSIPVPPSRVNVWESKSTLWAPPESPWKSKSWVVVWLSIYAFTLCWLATAVAEFEDISSSSLKSMSVADSEPLNIGILFAALVKPAKAVNSASKGCFVSA